MPSYGMYRSRNTLFQNLAPVTRIFILFSLMALSVFVSNLTVSLIILGFTIGIFIFAKVEVRHVRNFLRVGALLSLILAINWFIFAHTPGKPLFVIGPIRMTVLAIEGVSSNISRIFVLILGTIILISTTSERELVEGFRKVKTPYVITFIFMLALRFIPTLSSDLATIREAQMARGIEAQKGSLIERGRKLVTALIPLLVVSFRRAEIVSNALESRAFKVGGFGSSGRTFYKESQLRSWEFVIIGVCIATVGVMLFLFLAYGMFAGPTLSTA